MRRVVVLPQPDGPRSPKNSPWATSRETSATARVVPKLRETFLRDKKDILLIFHLSFSIYHFPFTERHLLQNDKWKMINGKWKMTCSSHCFPRPRISVSQYL